MLISCWSVKGGSGTTVVAATIALGLARSAPVLLADLAGDIPVVLGAAFDGTPAPGLGDWLAGAAGAAGAGHSGALDPLAVEIRPGLSVLPRGRPLPSGSGDRLIEGLTHLAGRQVVVADCGLLPSGADGPTWSAAAEADQSLLVMRTCYLALQRAVDAPLRPSGVVLIVEPGRMIGRAEVTEALGVPVVAAVPWDDRVARATDAGLLTSRVPWKVRRALRVAA